MSNDVKFYNPTPRMTALLDAVCRICNMDERDAKRMLVGRIDEVLERTQAPVCNVRDIASEYRLNMMGYFPKTEYPRVMAHLATLPGDLYDHVRDYSWEQHQKAFGVTKDDYADFYAAKEAETAAYYAELDAQHRAKVA